MVHKHIIQKRFDKHVQAIRDILISATLENMAEHKAFGLFVSVAKAEIEKLPEFINRGVCKDGRSRVGSDGAYNYKIDFEKIATIDWTRRDADIAEEFNVSRERIRQVRLMLEKSKVPKTKSDTTELRKSDNSTFEGKTLDECCEMFPNLSKNYIYTLLKRKGVQLKRKQSSARSPVWSLLNFDLSNNRLEDIWNLSYNAATRYRTHHARWSGSHIYEDPEFLDAISMETEKASNYNANRTTEEMEETRAKRIAKIEKAVVATKLSNEKVKNKKSPRNLSISLRGRMLEIVNGLSDQEQFSSWSIGDKVKGEFPHYTRAHIVNNLGRYLWLLCKEGELERISLGYCKGSRGHAPSVYKKAGRK
jgi:hypothetical protein